MPAVYDTSNSVPDMSCLFKDGAGPQTHMVELRHNSTVEIQGLGSFYHLTYCEHILEHIFQYMRLI